MIDTPLLLSTFNRLVRLLTESVSSHLNGAEPLHAELRASYDQAVSAGLTAAPWEEWRDEQVEQIAIGWLLGTIFARYAEDNGLIARTAPTADARQWWLSRLSSLADALATAPAQLWPAHSHMMSEDGAQLLIDFWQQHEEGGGQPAIDLRVPDLDTRFLGEVYQDLSESARRQYALLQTPVFVEEFVLDQTLEPAVERFGLEDLKVIDPVCGSGNFLLGAFARLLRHWAVAAPNMAEVERVRRALGAVHGVDLNPFAAQITRFRLLVAARQAYGSSTSLKSPTADWTINVAAGDSLLAEGDGFDAHPSLLSPGQYHVVVGNPPYHTVRDQALNARYRERYDTCVGKYALTVPFIQRFFELARNGGKEEAGYVGALVANSFTKREFGRRLVEKYFAEQVTLNMVVDSSGAFIPGHGTPTLILFGRSVPNLESDSVLIVAGLRGEPSRPADPGSGLVWQSILRHAHQGGGADRWTESRIVGHAALQSFPWQLSGSQPSAVMQRLPSSRILSETVTRISYLANTGADEIFTAPRRDWTRQHTEQAYVVDVVSGSDVRDWTAIPGRSAFFPRTGEMQTVDLGKLPGHHQRLWPYRTLLGNRPDYSGRSYFESNRAWYDWHSIAGSPAGHPLRIVFAWVSTHPHFAALDDTIALPSAPVIELGPQSSSTQRADLIALLNSSTACFWLKQVSNSKGVSSSHKSTGGGGEPWEAVYEFTPGRLKELPLPLDLSTSFGEELAWLAIQLEGGTPAKTITAGTPSSHRLAEARGRWNRLRARMVALAEEQDWEIYARYGLLPEQALAPGLAEIPLLMPGERAFEIALARAVGEGRETTQWFTRHGFAPVVDIPDHWPRHYRELVEARIQAIATHGHLNVLERPENKRRWATPSWEAMQQQALRDWLLDQCECPALWYDREDGRQASQVQTVSSLWEKLQLNDPVVEAASLYAPGKNFVEVLRELLADEAVPCLAALRYKDSGISKRADWVRAWQQQQIEDQARASGDDHAARDIRRRTAVPPKFTAGDFRKPSYWRLRGKIDMPSERFFSYPAVNDREGGPVLGWSGWNYEERAHALTTVIEEALASGKNDFDALIALTAAAQELLEVHNLTEIKAAPIDGFNRMPLDDWINRSGATHESIRRWRPKPAKRGRPPKSSAG
ncbi:BREX-2 system adenine-specific DNA-methyltransferase PglX [Micromonospora sp. DT68]|uniref:BREX-2 system adenine-specific DNA-methyltransferase PglX n=1 Tax=Micromonospora sp. DT68 TaxID=3416522 RepID=UPI003CF3E64C